MSRSRTRTPTDTFETVKAEERDPQTNALKTPWWSFSARTARVHEEMVDSVTPGFEVKSKQGQVFNNHMSQSSTTLNQPLSAISEYVSPKVDGNGQFVPNTGMLLIGQCTQWHLRHRLPILAPPFVGSSNLHNTARNRAFAELKLNQADLLVSLGEANETIELVAGVFRKTIGHVRKGRKLVVKRLASAISVRNFRDQYLAYQYGWRPLYKDMVSVITALQGGTYPQRITGRGFADDSLSHSSSGVKTGYHDGRCQVAYDYTAYSSRNVRAFALAEVGIAGPVFSEAVRWGLDRPAQAVWDLIPASFVVDWFADIGTWIDAWSPKPYLRVLAAGVVDTYTTSDELRCRLEPDPSYDPGANRTHSASASGVRTNETTSRVRIPVSTAAPLPGVSFSLKTQQVVDLSALLTTRFKGLNTLISKL